MTSRYTAVAEDGFTHASRVIPLERCSDAASGIVTTELVPLNCRALPYFPAADQVGLVIVPLCPLPVASVSVVPDPSSNPYAATRPVEADVVVAPATLE